MSLRSLLLPLLVFVLAGCLEQTPYTNVDNDELKSLIADGVPLYDIRRPDEWRSTGVIKGSKRLTFIDGRGQVSPQFLPEFTQRIGKDEPVILICRTGNRTDALARHLVEKMGYTKVYNVRRGITGWISEKRPVGRT
ncbi:MAG: rhodanese-like domain-containing protein [Pseudomonadota bacterium]